MSQSSKEECPRSKRYSNSSWEVLQQRPFYRTDFKLGDSNFVKKVVHFKSRFRLQHKLLKYGSELISWFGIDFKI